MQGKLNRNVIRSDFIPIRTYVHIFLQGLDDEDDDEEDEDEFGQFRPHHQGGMGGNPGGGGVGGGGGMSQSGFKKLKPDVNLPGPTNLVVEGREFMIGDFMVIKSDQDRDSAPIWR